MGVWKAGSANYIWRYNDTRKYRSSSSSLLGEYQLPTIITALKIAPNDLCTYVGNSRGVLSMSDFREPYIQDLGVVQRDGICSIELIGEQQILVGTQSGDIELYDVRFARNDGKPGPLRSFKLPTDTAASQIQACPSSPHRVFACSSGKNVYIYLNEVDSGALPVFTHLGHQTAVADFRWHPGQGYDYTIGSIETGGESGRGLIQVWRPADLIVNDWQLGRT
ncbi:hypothetical protein LPJ75_007270 [Coemansia sp. RSA 2598]|nr:hypothetical protein LPJ75_007270 [Coemansia sp. RSA 2598]